ncbi:MAG: F0F1 ATP synthase subunit B [Candidatus Moraniibacteriota bacterium]
MDALANLGIDWKLFVAQAVNFLILLFILKKFAYKPILGLLDERSQKIEKGLRDAEEAERKLTASLEEEKKIIAAAREEAREVLMLAEASAKKRDVEMLAQTKAKIDKMITEADAHLAEEQKKLLRDAKAELSGVVLSALEKVLGEKVDEKTDKVLIEKALQSLHQ